MAEPKPGQTGKSQSPQRVSIEIPKELEAIYANIAFISHTPAEIVLDFAQFLPRTPKGSVKARVIMSPMHAKMLQNALAQNIANYERQFGEIKIPKQPSLADQLFRFPPQNPDDEEGDSDSDE